MSVRSVKMPDLGEGVVESEIVEWMVAVGDAVTVETPMVEVMTDKASVEINAPFSGVIAELVVAEGATITVGSDLVRIDDGGVPGDDGVDQDAAPQVVTPEEPVDDEVVDTPNATPTAAGSASARGIEAVSETNGAGGVAAASAGPPTASGERPVRPLAAPTVRRLARDLDIDLRAVVGTGPGGRVLREDVEAHRGGGGGGAAPLPRRPDVTEPVRGIRKAIAHHLTTAWEAPHITYVEEVDLTELEGFRSALNDRDADRVEGADAPMRLTPLPFIARAVMRAVSDHPRMNATYDHSEGMLHQIGAVHLGIATQTDRGLLVPVIHDADQLSLRRLATDMRRVADAARDGSADRHTLSGSTITISSLGALGGLVTTPVINAPEVAVIGINKLRIAPMWNGTSFEPRSMMNVSASFDHRVIDGWDAAVFVQRIKELLETPAMLTLGWAE